MYLSGIIALLRYEFSIFHSSFQFLLLASSLLEFMHKIFPVAAMVGFKKQITTSLSEEKLTNLAKILVESQRDEILKCLTILLSLFVVDGYFDTTSQLVSLLSR